jgi:hypothetical protein
LRLLGCRAFFHGHFPTYNPYQFMGAPLNTIGCYMFLYPFLYIAYGIAAYVLDNPNATEDVLTIGHLAMGYAATWLLSRAIGLRPSLAALTALTVSLSGFALIGGRSWDNVPPLMVYLPLVILQLVRLSQRQPDGWWVLKSSIVLALFMNAGFIQLWLYAMILALLWVAVAVAVGGMPARRLLCLIPVAFIAAAFFMPQALCFHQVADRWARHVGEGPRVVPSNIFNCLLPAPLAPPIGNGDGAFPWGSMYYRDMGELYYSGTILTSIGLAASCVGLVQMAFPTLWSVGVGWRRRLDQNVWGLLALVALIFSVGSQAPLWPLLSALPLFDKMESPFKFVPFFNLFVALQGALVLERWVTAGGAETTKVASRDAHVSCPVPRLSLPGIPRRRMTMAILGVVGAALLIWHVALALPAFYSYSDRPYPPLPTAEASALQSDGVLYRVLPITPFRSITPRFTCSLANNWPTDYQVYAFGGYDSAVEAFPAVILTMRNMAAHPDQALRAYGVAWIVVHRTVTNPVYSDNSAIRVLESPDDRLRPAYMAECYRHRPVATTADVTLFNIAGVDPLAYAVLTYPQPLPKGKGVLVKISLRITTSATGIDVDLTPAHGGDIVVNFLAYKALVAEIDGRGVPIYADGWGRIVVRAPEGGRRLTIRYAMPWTASVACGIVLLVMGLGLWWLLWFASPCPER